MKYSIIVPVYDQLDYTKQCLYSVVDNTKNWNEYELIIVANGCTDGTEEWLSYFQRTYKADTVLCSYTKPMGFGGATNAGMRLSCGEYLILLNNDCKILSPAWIKLLEAPFIENPKVGITGPIKYWSEITKAHALIFFCVMIHRKVVDKIGFLDDKTFPIGAGEDTDFCARAQKAGFLIEQVPKEGLFPIYHLGEATLNTIPDWNERLYWEHREALKKKYAV
jgi:GT2 family glycosyltransferase